MKINKITAAIFTVIAHTVTCNAFADTIIQKGSGDFYIVSNEEANKLFNRNNFGFFAVPPSPNVIPKNKPLKHVRPASSRKTAPVKPVINRPVTTVEPAESIFLRLEKKANES